MNVAAAPTIEALSAQLDALYGNDPAPQHVLDAALDVFAEHMRALTVRQSWAGFIAAAAELGDDAKDVENRTRPIRHRGPILIHSSAAMDDMRNAPAWMKLLLPRVPERLHACGRVLAVARIAGCHPSARGCCDTAWAERSGGVWHWEIKDVRALPEPIPAKGRLGLWKPGRDLVAAVLQQLTEASDA